MEKEISFDFGGTFTDIVIFVDGKIQKKIQKKRSDFGPQEITSFLGKEKYDQIFTVGGNQKEVPEEINGQRIQKTKEIEAIGAGGEYLSEDGVDKKMIVSLGTGVCFVLSEKNNFTHIGGSAVGGGTITGLGKIILGEPSLEKLALLAKNGDENKVNLTVKDIVGEGIGLLPDWVPASYFAKAADNQKEQSKEDLARSIFSMCAGVIASSAVFAAKSQNLNEFFLGGRLANSDLIFEEIKKIGEIFEVGVKRIPQAEIMTAVGAREAGKM